MKVKQSLIVEPTDGVGECDGEPECKGEPNLHIRFPCHMGLHVRLCEACRRRLLMALLADDVIRKGESAVLATTGPHGSR